MSSEITLSVHPRTGTGRKAAKRLRRDGLVPAALYGGEQDPMPVQIAERDIEDLLRHHSLTSIISLEVQEGESSKVLVREVLRHPLTEKLVHLDLLRVSERSRVTIDVPIVLIGHAAGIEEGGVLDQVQHTVSIECAAMSIPEHITVDVSALEIGDNISVSDLVIPEGVRMLTDPDATVATVSIPQEITEEEPAEGEEEERAEPELIGHEDDDEDDDEDEK